VRDRARAARRGARTRARDLGGRGRAGRRFARGCSCAGARAGTTPVMAIRVLRGAVAGMPGLLLSAASAGDGSVRAAPAASQPMAFGAPLSEAPDPEFACDALPPLGGSATPPASCVFSTPLSPSDPAQGLITPVGSGTITGVRIRVGASTGPMSLVVLESEK